MSMNTPDCIDLEWLAFQYIAGELSVEEAESFERRLEADQSAREVLARTVQISQAIAALPPQTVAVDKHPVRRRSLASWVVPIAAAASLAFALGLSLAHRGADVAQLPGGGAPAESAGLAHSTQGLTDLWLQSERAAATLREILQLDAADAGDGESMSAAADLDADVDVPGWMIAAAAVIDPPGPNAAIEFEDTPLEN
jgi:hypothetical protein